MDSTKAAHTLAAAGDRQPDPPDPQAAGRDGHIHWNMKSLMRNTAFDEVLEREVYQQPALMPPSPWLGEAHLKRPKLSASP